MTSQSQLTSWMCTITSPSCCGEDLQFIYPFSAEVCDSAKLPFTPTYQAYAMKQNSTFRTARMIHCHIIQIWLHGYCMSILSTALYWICHQWSYCLFVPESFHFQWKPYSNTSLHLHPGFCWTAVRHSGATRDGNSPGGVERQELKVLKDDRTVQVITSRPEV